MRKQLAKTLEDVMTANDQVVVMIGDISHYLLEGIESKFSGRFYNMGIAEQTLIGMASGLGLEGKIPFVHTIAPFCTERVYEQIKLDLGYQQVEAFIISVGASFDYAHMGSSHHCPNDIAILRVVPNLDIYMPGSAKEFDEIIKKTLGNGRAKYIKATGREHQQSFEIQPGEIKKIKQGSDDKLIITTGHMLEDIIGLPGDPTVFYTYSINQFNAASVKALKQEMAGKSVYVVEENNMVGGLGDAIADLTDIRPIKIGIPNRFLEHYGTYDDLRKDAGLDSGSLKARIYAD